MRDTPAVRVEERNGMQLDGPIFDLESHEDVQRMEVDISVRKHHILGICAGAAGIEELSQGVFVDGVDVGAMRRGCCEKRVVVAGVEPRRVRRTVKLNEHFYRAKTLAKRFH